MNVIKIFDYMYTPDISFNAILIDEPEGEYIQLYYRHDNNEVKTGFKTSFYNSVKYDRVNKGYVWLFSDYYDQYGKKKYLEYNVHIFDITEKFSERQL